MTPHASSKYQPSYDLDLIDAEDYPSPFANAFKQVMIDGLF